MGDVEEHFFIIPSSDKGDPLLSQSSRAIQAVKQELGHIDLHILDVLEQSSVRIRLLIWPNSEFATVLPADVRSALVKNIALA